MVLRAWSYGLHRASGTFYLCNCGFAHLVACSQLSALCAGTQAFQHLTALRLVEFRRSSHPHTLGLSLGASLGRPNAYRVAIRGDDTLEIVQHHSDQRTQHHVAMLRLGFG